MRWISANDLPRVEASHVTRAKEQNAGFFVCHCGSFALDGGVHCQLNAASYDRPGSICTTSTLVGSSSNCADKTLANPGQISIAGTHKELLLYNLMHFNNLPFV